jgi:hypothetical protein
MKHALTWDTWHHISIHNVTTPIISPNKEIQCKSISDDHLKCLSEYKDVLIEDFTKCDDNATDEL